MNEIYLLSTGIVQAERPAQLLQTVAGEIRENLVRARTSRTGQRVDEPGLDAAIGNLQLVESTLARSSSAVSSARTARFVGIVVFRPSP